MNTRNIVRLAALGFGMYLVLEALSSASFILADKRLYSDSPPYIYAGMQMLGAAILAGIIYVYSGKMHFDESEIHPLSLLQAGMKLFGVYLLIKSVPLFLGGVVSTLFPVPEVSVVSGSVRPLSIGMAYAAIGYLLLFKTDWVVRKVNSKNVV